MNENSASGDGYRIAAETVLFIAGLRQSLYQRDRFSAEADQDYWVRWNLDRDR